MTNQITSHPASRNAKTKSRLGRSVPMGTMSHMAAMTTNKSANVPRYATATPRLRRPSRIARRRFSQGAFLLAATAATAARKRPNIPEINAKAAVTSAS